MRIVLHLYVIILYMLQRIIILDVMLLECVPFAKTNIFKYSFRNRIIPIWNTLPESIVTSNVISAFK